MQETIMLFCWDDSDSSGILKKGKTYTTKSNLDAEYYNLLELQNIGKLNVFWHKRRFVRLYDNFITYSMF